MVKNEYVTIAEATKIMGKDASAIGRLCRDGRLDGAEKLGTAGWIIPIETIKNFTPKKRGPKTKKDKLATERAELLKDLQ